MPHRGVLFEPFGHEFDPLLEPAPRLPAEVRAGLSIVGDPRRCVPASSRHRAPSRLRLHPAEPPHDVDHRAQRGLDAGPDVVDRARGLWPRRRGDERVAYVVHVDVVAGRIGAYKGRQCIAQATRQQLRYQARRLLERTIDRVQPQRQDMRAGTARDVAAIERSRGLGNGVRTVGFEPFALRRGVVLEAVLG